MQGQILVNKNNCYVKVGDVWEPFAMDVIYTPWYSLPQYNWVKYRRVGNLVEIRVSYDSTTAFKLPDWTNIDLGVLPVGFRPGKYYEGRILTCYNDTSVGRFTKFDISTDGVIKLFHWMATASYKRIQGHIVYRVSEQVK